jgi:threonine dehydratase
LERRHRSLIRARLQVDEWIVVDEQAIEAALVHLVTAEHKLVEGAAALTLAAYWQAADRFANTTCVLVMCGANISASTLRRVLGS